MSKGKLLLQDFLNKLGKAMKTSNWDDLTACWAARERLEAYLDPPRDEHGHFLSQEQGSDLVRLNPDVSTDVANPPSDPKRKANT